MSELPLTQRREVAATIAKGIYDFGIVDDKGRKVGAWIWTGQVAFYMDPEKTTSGYRREPGTYYFGRVHATRGGTPFGASQPERYFATERAQWKWKTKYLANAQKRAAKKFGH